MSNNIQKINEPTYIIYFQSRYIVIWFPFRRLYSSNPCPFNVIVFFVPILHSRFCLKLLSCVFTLLFSRKLHPFLSPTFIHLPVAVVHFVVVAVVDCWLLIVDVYVDIDVVVVALVHTNKPTRNRIIHIYDINIVIIFLLFLRILYD